MVGEYFVFVEAGSVRAGGKYRSKNVGISNKNLGENPRHRKSKVSWATMIDPGLGDPKANPD